MFSLCQLLNFKPCISTWLVSKSYVTLNQHLHTVNHTCINSSSEATWINNHQSLLYVCLFMICSLIGWGFFFCFCGNRNSYFAFHMLFSSLPYSDTVACLFHLSSLCLASLNTYTSVGLSLSVFLGVIICIWAVLPVCDFSCSLHKFSEVIRFMNWVLGFIHVHPLIIVTCMPKHVYAITLSCVCCFNTFNLIDNHFIFN